MRYRYECTQCGHASCDTNEYKGVYAKMDGCSCAKCGGDDMSLKSQKFYEKVDTPNKSIAKLCAGLLLVLLLLLMLLFGLYYEH